MLSDLTLAQTTAQREEERFTVFQLFFTVLDIIGIVYIVM